MKLSFAAWMEQVAGEDPNIIFLTGDLGFNALENLERLMQDRFINVGVAEQNMVGMAAALAHLQNEHGPLRPFCYSIAPFLAYRACEQIRVDLCLHGKNGKIEFQTIGHLHCHKSSTNVKEYHMRKLHEKVNNSLRFTYINYSRMENGAVRRPDHDAADNV